MTRAFELLREANPVPTDTVASLADSPSTETAARAIVLKARRQDRRSRWSFSAGTGRSLRELSLRSATVALALVMFLALPGRAVVSAAVEQVSSWLDSGSGSVLSESGSEQGTVHTNGIITSAVPDGNHGWFISGTFTRVDGARREHLAHLQADASLDPEWHPSLTGPEPARYTSAVLALGGSRLYAGGSFSTVNGKQVGNVVALKAATGAVVSGWQTDLSASNEVTALAVNGPRLFVAGGFDESSHSGGDAISCRLIAVKTADGAPDREFRPSVRSIGEGGGGCVQALATSGSNVLIGGSFNYVDGQRFTGFAALDQETGIVASNRPSVNLACAKAAGCKVLLPTVTAISATHGRVYVAGEFTGVDGHECNSVVALSLETSQLASGFTCPQLDDRGIFDLALAVAGSHLYLGGDFKTVNSEPRNGFAVFDAESGSLLSNWAPSSLGDYVSGLSVSGSSVLVSGVEEGGK